MNKVLTIIRKEWAEVFKNRMVLFTVAFLPLIMTVIPLGILFAMRGEAEFSELTTELPESFTAYCPSGMSGGECFQVFMVSQFMFMFMILPLAIPATIAAYSIVGEKTTRSLEPLLATPITTVELLSGKSLAAVIPAVGATYAAFGLFVLGSWLLVHSRLFLMAVLEARWLLAIFILSPLMAFLAVLVSVMVSSRVNDPRVAEQLSMVVILPVLGFFFAQIAGLIVLSSQLVWVGILIFCILDVILLYFAERLFQRETILTRWK